MRLGVLSVFGAALALQVPGCATESGGADEASAALTKHADPAGAPYPIVLLHGMAGFGKIEVGGVTLTYFDGIVEDLARHGETAYVTLVPPFAGSEARAKALAPQIDDILRRTGKSKVNFVAHSQGGLDARILASPNGLGYGDRVASITTVGTPHHGTRVVDAMLGLLDGVPADVVEPIANAFFQVLERKFFEVQTDPDLRDALTAVTERHMETVFNPKYVNDPRVAYASYAGRSNLSPGLAACGGSVFPNDPFALDVVQAQLLPAALFLEADSLKVNDGLVTVDSARWGTFEQCVPADHLGEVGHPGLGLSFDQIGLFRTIVSRLRSASL